MRVKPNGFFKYRVVPNYVFYIKSLEPSGSSSSQSRAEGTPLWLHIVRMLLLLQRNLYLHVQLVLTVRFLLRVGLPFL